MRDLVRNETKGDAAVNEYVMVDTAVIAPAG